MGSSLQPGQSYTQQMNLMDLSGTTGISPQTTNQQVYSYLNNGSTSTLPPTGVTPTNNMINSVLGTNGSTSLTSGLIGSDGGLGNINPASYTTNSVFAGSSYTPTSTAQMAAQYLNNGNSISPSSGILGQSSPLSSGSSSSSPLGTSQSPTPNLSLPDSPLCATLVSSINAKEYVNFYTMPTISETSKAEWKEMNMVQAPGGILSYGGTKSRSFSVRVKFVSRTSVEAGISAYFVQLLRGWKMPYFGSSNKKLLGAPPPVLYFTAFSDENTRPTYVTNYNRIPVVIDSLDVTYNGEADFIRALCPISQTLGDPFPTIMEVTVGLKEAHAPIEYLNFDLHRYKQGNLAGF